MSRILVLKESFDEIVHRTGRVPDRIEVDETRGKGVRVTPDGEWPGKTTDVKARILAGGHKPLEELKAKDHADKEALD